MIVGGLGSGMRCGGVFGGGGLKGVVGGSLKRRKAVVVC